MEMSVETILGIMMIVIGFVSLGLMVNARGRLQESGELKRIINRCALVVVFLVCYSLWHVIREAFHLKKAFGEVIEYPEYVFISLAYIMILRTARALYNIANILQKIGVVKK